MLATAAHVKIKGAKCKHNNKAQESTIIFIDAENTIYADDPEHVPGDVCFFAAARCTVLFSDPNVFGKAQHPLTPGENWLTPKNNGRTSYSIEGSLSYQAAQSPLTGPIIVVP